MSEQGIINGDKIGKINIVICPNCQKQFSILEEGTICKDCSKLDYETNKVINPIKKVRLTIDLGKLFEESKELERLKEDIRKNTSLNYQQGETELESITYYGKKFIKQKEVVQDVRRKRRRRNKNVKF